jgi:hypothetical protein
VSGDARKKPAEIFMQRNVTAGDERAIKRELKIAKRKQRQAGG